MSNDDAYINLAGAIVRVTLEDYEYTLTMIQLYPNDAYYASQKKSLERIIKSEYFDMLCLNICPEKLIRDIHNLYYGPKGYQNYIYIGGQQNGKGESFYQRGNQENVKLSD